MLPFLIVSALCGCDVFVMAPLDLIDNNCNPSFQSKFENWCNMLRDANVKGVMLDVWWGITEPSPKNYRWQGYETVFNIMRNKGLKIIPVFSFHQCGGSVGDYVNIPIPSFVWQGASQPHFIDSYGNKEVAYISFSYDNVKIGPNNERTPLEMYNDWMTAFKVQFNSYIEDGSIIEIEVGVGPCGELRYPSYRQPPWSYPGCGQFQCYDSEYFISTKALDSSSASVTTPRYTFAGLNPRMNKNNNNNNEQVEERENDVDISHTHTDRLLFRPMRCARPSIRLFQKC